MRIISKYQAPPEGIVSRLQSHFFVISSASSELNTGAATRAPLQSYNQRSKPSSKRISEILRSLLIISGVSIEKTPNTS